MCRRVAKMVFLKAAFPRQAKKWSTRYNDCEIMQRMKQKQQGGTVNVHVDAKTTKTSNIQDPSKQQWDIMTTELRYEQVPTLKEFTKFNETSNI